MAPPRTRHDHILALAASGLSCHQIARNLKMSKSTITMIVTGDPLPETPAPTHHLQDWPPDMRFEDANVRPFRVTARSLPAETEVWRSRDIGE
jgi:hypothetical protein